MRKAPLDGIRVLDLTQVMAGPYATMIMGDLGAEVIKVESPDTGEMSRTFPPHFIQETSAYFLSLNRSKKSIVLNLQTHEGKEIFYRMVRKSDVVIYNFRPGIAERLKIDYGILKTVNPDIICCSMTAFGPDGPYGAQPAYDLTIQALSGAMSMTGEPGRSPLRLGIPMGDLAASLYAVVGVVSALYARKAEGGGGQLIDLALLDALFSLITYPAVYYFIGGEIPQPLGSGHQSVVPFQAFPTKDRYITICAPTEKFWSALCGALGREDLANDPRFATAADRLRNKDELHAIMEGILRQKSCEEWYGRLVDAGVPCAPVNTVDHAIHDPAIRHRDMIVEVQHREKKFKMVGNPLKFSGHPPSTYQGPPGLGEHSEEILVNLLGYSREDVKRFREANVIQ
ncbi:MAG: CoA transferase [Deltaproteobacteria bacterium]|nr:CoA transferase [Deltaproteobacteria bacterium]